MNPDEYFYDEFKKSTGRFKDLAQEVKGLDRNLWSQLIGVQAAVLGISISLLGYQNAKPGFWLFCTWILEIVSIISGFVVLALDSKQTFRSGLHSYMFALDMNDIILKDSKGEFRTNPDKKLGMVVAACLKNSLFNKEVKFSDHARQLAEKYGNDLQSSHLFKDLPPRWRSRMAEALLKYFPIVEDVFYLSFAVSFVTLILSLVLKA